MAEANNSSPESFSNPQVVYRCKKCRRIVATQESMVTHERGKGESCFKWSKRSGKQRGVENKPAECTSIFVEPMKWMEALQDGHVEEKLICIGCKARLGSFNWAGMQCSCGAWVNPAFQLHKSRFVSHQQRKLLPASLFNCFTDMTVTEMRVHMDCSGCEKQVRKALESLEGVDDVIIDLRMQKVTVMGWTKQKKILKAVRRNGRTAELWPYPYNPQYHGFIHHYQHLNSPQHHHHQPQPQPKTKPLITYNSLSSSSSHKHKNLTHDYNSYDYNGSSIGNSYDYNGNSTGRFTTGHVYYEEEQEPPFSTIDEETGALFSDDNPHSCAAM